MRKLIFGIGFIGSLFLSVQLAAQNASNPFELVPRLSVDQLESETTENLDTAKINPFDIIYESPRPDETSSYVVDTKVDPIITSDYGRFKFFSVGILLLLLVVGVSIVGNTYRKSVLSFLNDNMFNQFYREREGRGALAYYILYTLFFINLGFFLVLLLQHYQIDLPLSNFYFQWMALSGGLFLVFMLKQLLLLYIGSIFPIQRDISKYIFLIIVMAITLGAVLIALNLLLAYGPAGSAQTIIYISLGIIALFYVFRAIRGLFIANKYLVFHRFHFLLYICTVEIAPVVIILRYLLNQV